jgi:hypothetical protein
MQKLLDVKEIQSFEFSLKEQLKREEENKELIKILMCFELHF